MKMLERLDDATAEKVKQAFFSHFMVMLLFHRIDDREDLSFSAMKTISVLQNCRTR